MVHTRSGRVTFNPMSRLWESLRQSEMENPFPPLTTSLGRAIPSSSNLGMPNSTSTQESKDPFRNTTLGVNDEEVYQDEDPIDVPSDVRTFLVDPYNLEMMEKSIRANKTEIFLNLVKDGVNVPTRFD